MIKAYQKDREFLQSVKEASSDEGCFHLWWLGQSGYLVKWKDIHWLIDPYLSDSLTHKYAKTDKPHVRMSEQVVRPEALDFIDAVSSSHNHTDHLDGKTLIPLMKVNPELEVIVPEANRDFVANRIQCEPSFPLGLDAGSGLTLRSGIHVHGVPAAHNSLERDEKGHCKFLGYVFQFGPFSLYHSGDTLWHEGLAPAVKPFSVDVAILPINGNVPERRVAGNLSAKEAVQLAQAIDARVLIPCHYHMFYFNTVDPNEFIALARKAKLKYQVLQGGEACTFYAP